jgi:XTP/dITP diphosphohydrolase
MRRWADLLRKGSAVDFTIAETGLAKRGFMDFSESARGARRASQQVSRAAGAGLALVEPAMELPGGTSRYTSPMAIRLFAATTSKGKLRDFRTAAEAHGIDIQPLAGLEAIEAPEEDGTTFADNATLKAVYYSRFAPGELVLADDSGLEVDALDGAPGVRSARFAADAGLVDSPDAASDNTDVWNNMILLQRLAGVSPATRTARYRCVLAAARDGEVLHIAEGAVEGLILEAPRGTGGFGYDPLFYLPGLERTMAEIDLETKLSLSHRGRAIAALLPMLIS